MQDYFVNEGSVVRKIWGRSDMILFIFAGGAAQFALNKSVDWLYFTGRLPSDPIGRLFSTVGYARSIVFGERESAIRAIDSMSAIHSKVEEKRGSRIPDWAYRDVLYMLIDYSIRAHEIFDRQLSNQEKQETFRVFHEVGVRMGLAHLPSTYDAWLVSREEHLRDDLQVSRYTKDLFSQYRKHLGWVRYILLLEAQKLIAPEHVRNLLNFKRPSLLKPVIAVYRWSRFLQADALLRRLAIPPLYRKQLVLMEKG